MRFFSDFQFVVLFLGFLGEGVSKENPELDDFELPSKSSYILMAICSTVISSSTATLSLSYRVNLKNGVYVRIR